MQPLARGVRARHSRRRHRDARARRTGAVEADPAKERARLLVSDCLRYAQFYNKDQDIWKKFTDNKFIDVAAFPTLLESSDVLLSESEIEAMIKEM